MVSRLRSAEKWKLDVIAMENVAGGGIWNQIKNWAERVSHLKLLVGVFGAVLGLFATGAVACYKAGAIITDFQGQLRLIDAKLANVPAKADFEAFKGQVHLELAGMKTQIGKVEQAVRIIAAQTKVDPRLIGSNSLTPSIPWGGRNIGHPAPSADCSTQGDRIVCAAGSVTPLLAAVAGSVETAGATGFVLNGTGDSLICESAKVTILAKSGQHVRQGDLIGYAEAGTTFSLQYRRADRIIQPPAVLATASPKLEKPRQPVRKADPPAAPALLPDGDSGVASPSGVIAKPGSPE